MSLTLLVDTSSLLYRAFYSVPETVKADDGRPMNGAYGFLNMLARLTGDLRPANVCCALDDDWRPQWRVDLLEAYKAHRVADPEAGDVEDAVAEQEAELREILDLAGVATAGAAGYEAEDVIGTLAARTRGPVAIVSGDRDLFQLVEDPRVWVLYPRKGVSDLVRVDEAEITRRYGIPGRAYADFAVLRGDPSDGLPGVRGIGEKTATALIAKHGSLDGVVAAAAGATAGPLAKVAANLDYVERAAQVVRIPRDVEVGEVDLAFPRHAPAPELEARATALGLAGPVRRLLATIAPAARKRGT